MKSNENIVYFHFLDKTFFHSKHHDNYWSWMIIGVLGFLWGFLESLTIDWLIDWLIKLSLQMSIYISEFLTKCIDSINKYNIWNLFFLSTDNGRRGTKQRKKFYCVADACIDKQWIVYVIFPNKLYVYYAKLICQISMKHSMFIVLSCCKF